MEAIDPFYDPAEEARAKEQASRNSLTRSLLKSRGVSPEKVSVDQDDSSEFIRINEPSLAHVEVSDGRNNRVYWLPTHGYPPYDNYFLRLHQEILDFTRWVSLTNSEQKSRESFINRLNGVCKALWPKSKVVPFGSFLTGLSLPTSDVDVSVIHVPIPDDELGQVSCLRRLADTLLAEQQVSFIELRESAKVPILRIKDREFPHCEIDININVDSPQATSKFIIRNAIEVYPQFRPLTLFIKCFLYQRNLADTFTGGIGSYLLSCLVLGFLQQHAITSQPRMNELTSLGHLMFDFFNYYAKEFRVDREGISVRRGGSRFPKSSRQFEFSRASLTNRRTLSFQEALCVESPLEPELDIGNKVFQWKVVRSAFMQARQVMVDDIQNFDPMDSNKSLISPGLLNAFNPMFVRASPDQETPSLPACPLQGFDELKFRERSDSIPPSPYSDDAIDLESPVESEEDFNHKRRRYSDEPPRRWNRESHGYHRSESYSSSKGKGRRYRY